VLFPGDVLFIPDKQQKTVQRPTTQVHVFQVALPKLKLRVIVLDRKGNPLPNVDCELEIEGETHQLKTGGDGLLEKPIPPSASSGNLKVPFFDLESPVKIGHLDPIEERSGQIGRLANLGYYRSSLDPVDEDEFKSALEEFQCDFHLHVDGIMGAQSMAKLKSVHGC
jgi:N-acetylmuramoyl-L-alanine amidase